MKKFMADDFLLETDVAREIYSFAEKMPIIDYHCHLDPKEIAEDRRFENIAQMWLGADHYKWRAMRGFGIDEKLITGDADDFDKFNAWVSAVPYLIGNPLFHWTYLELKRYFDIDVTVNEKNAKYIWDKANERIASPEFSAVGLIKKSNVELICTTDDPFDPLDHHCAIAASPEIPAKVLPTFRTDNIINIQKDGYPKYIEKITSVMGAVPDDIEALKNAILQRMELFAKAGCRVSDVGLDTVPYAVVSEEAANSAYKKRLSGETLSEAEVYAYQTYMFVWLGKQYAKRDWVMQVHISVMRNNNTLMFNKIGPDRGFDSINDGNLAVPLSRLLDAMAVTDELPKTVLYYLNPKDIYVLGTMLGNFQSGNGVSKIQLGSAWWFNDHKDGMENQLKTLANLGVLPKFVGMLTDSRSFLSYARHEYFRRILCNVIGNWVENGEYPYDIETLEKIVCDISYNNIKEYI